VFRIAFRWNFSADITLQSNADNCSGTGAYLLLSDAFSEYVRVISHTGQTGRRLSELKKKFKISPIRRIRKSSPQVCLVRVTYADEGGRIIIIIYEKRTRRPVYVPTEFNGILRSRTVRNKRAS